MDGARTVASPVSEPDDDRTIQLAAPVSEQQLQVLRLLHYRGSSPSTGPQAAGIIHELLCVPAPEEHA